MSILLLLIPLSLMLVGIAAWAFAWAVRRGQFDDLDTPALDILGDDHRESDPVGWHGGSDGPGNGCGVDVLGDDPRTTAPVGGHCGPDGRNDGCGGDGRGDDPCGADPVGGYGGANDGCGGDGGGRDAD